MEIKKAIITAAGKGQRTLPLQSLVDRDGVSKTALAIIIEEILQAGVEEICVVTWPGDQAAYANAAGSHAPRLRFVEQTVPLGYGHAVYSARAFAGDEPFLLLVGDHLYVSGSQKRCAQQLVEIATAENCAVSAVQATHESKLPYYGAIGGRLVPGRQRLYEVQDVLEKPTPTEAEQRLIVPGLRAGHYLCFFGMHVLTPALMEILAEDVAQASHPPSNPVGHASSLPSNVVGHASSLPSTEAVRANPGGIHLTSALAKLAGRERYLTSELQGRRYDIGVKYGLLTAQLALALDGNNRDEVLSGLVELLANRAR